MEWTLKIGGGVGMIINIIGTFDDEQSKVTREEQLVFANKNLAQLVYTKSSSSIFAGH